MCLIALSWRADARFPLAVAANRDEFYRRRSLPAEFWDDIPGLLAGRDEQAGGTWLGVHNSGRFAAVTNARGVGAPGKQPPSRGELVRDFLNSDSPASEYAHSKLNEIHQYAGCNLLLADKEKLFYLTNHPEPEFRELAPGRYALSNGHIDDHWPKMRRLADSLNKVLDDEQAETENLLEILRNRDKPPAEELPNTGVGKPLEKQLSPIFIQMPVYGTRCSTAILANTAGQLHFHERSYVAGGKPAGDVEYTIDWPMT